MFRAPRGACVRMRRRHTGLLCPWTMCTHRRTMQSHLLSCSRGVFDIKTPAIQRPESCVILPAHLGSEQDPWLAIDNPWGQTFGHWKAVTSNLCCQSVPSSASFLICEGRQGHVLAGRAPSLSHHGWLVDGHSPVPEACFLPCCFKCIHCALLTLGMYVQRAAPSVSGICGSG